MGKREEKRVIKEMGRQGRREVIGEAAKGVRGEERRGEWPWGETRGETHV